MEINAELLYNLALEEIQREKDEKIKYKALAMEFEKKIKELEGENGQEV